MSPARAAREVSRPRCCLGIHGQLVYADRAARTMVVTMSSWPDARSIRPACSTLRACAAVAATAVAR